MKNPIRLFLVIPCYNEEKVITTTAEVLLRKLTEMEQEMLITQDSKIVFVNDGSKDNTWNIITQMNSENPIFRGINLSRNRGHQNALLAGLMTVKEEAEAVISLDADLQDDIGILDEFVRKYQEGFDVVYGVRSARDTDTRFKKYTASFFYKLMRLLGADVIENHADYRLLSQRVLKELSEYKEVNLFLRGMIPLVGFDSAVVSYERKERFAGESKYPLKKMLSFAFDGITSFSNRPIRMITTLGIIIFCISILALMYLVLGKLIFGKTVPGWTSLIVSIWGLGGLQLLAVGIIGEYIGKIYLETKARPRYIIKDYLK